MSSISIAIRPYVDATAAFLKNVGYTAKTPAGAFLAAASAVIGGTAVYLFNRISSSNKLAAGVAAAAISDKPLSSNVASGEATSVSALFEKITNSIKGWANSFVSFMSGLVPASFRGKAEEAAAKAENSLCDAAHEASEQAEIAAEAAHNAEDVAENAKADADAAEEAAEKAKALAANIHAIAACDELNKSSAKDSDSNG